MKKSFLNLSKEQLNLYICPLLLAIAVFFASLYTFNKPSAYILAALYSIVAVLLFKWFDSLLKRKSGAFIYALVLAAVLFVSFALVTVHAATFGFYSPVRWLYAQDDSEAFQPALTMALAIGGGYFLTSIIYYFTIVRYRTMGIMLCTLFPFFFFAKRSDDMPNILITLIMLLFLAVIIHNKRIGKTEKAQNTSGLKIDRAYIICISVFILITGAITMAVEKPYYQSFLEKNSRLLTPFSFGGGNSSAFEELSEQSSPRNGRPNYNYEPLFYFETDSNKGELFLRTKSFDYFNGDVWINSDAENWIFYSIQNPEYSTDDIISDITALNNADSSGLFGFHSARVFDDDFLPQYLPAPYATVTDDKSANSLVYRKLISDTSIWRTLSYYNIPPLDDKFAFIEQEPGIYGFVKELNFSSEEYIAFLDSKGEDEHAVRLSADYEKALENYTDMSNISERLINLSRQITSDCHSDIEKAEKLEKYFSENGFLYSLDFVPEDNSVDYFVFESKTGYCAGYATAMTLMARSVGLPARYVEGFAAFEKNDNNQFVIRDGYAHAFVEIYIPGAGWLTFDPTVSGYKDNPYSSAASDNLGFLSKVFNAFNRISVIIVIAIIILLFSVLDRIRELFVRLSLRFRPLNERIISLYGNLIKTVGSSVGSDFSAYTPDMMRRFLSEERHNVPERLISLFEKTAFGGYECTEEEYTLAYKEYKKNYKYFRRTPKKQKNQD